MTSSPINRTTYYPDVRLGELTQRAFALPGMPTTGYIHLTDVSKAFKKYYRAKVHPSQLREVVMKGVVPSTRVGMACLLRWEDVPALARHLGILVTPNTQ